MTTSVGSNEQLMGLRSVRLINLSSGLRLKMGLFYVQIKLWSQSLVSVKD